MLAHLQSVYGGLNSCAHASICMLRLGKHFGYAVQQAARLQCVNTEWQTWRVKVQQIVGRAGAFSLTLAGLKGV